MSHVITDLHLCVHQDGFTHADGSNVTVTKWYPGQPDNFGGHEDCVEMTHKGNEKEIDSTDDHLS